MAQGRVETRLVSGIRQSFRFVRQARQSLLLATWAELPVVSLAPNPPCRVSQEGDGVVWLLEKVDCWPPCACPFNDTTYSVVSNRTSEKGFVRRQPPAKTPETLV